MSNPINGQILAKYPLRARQFQFQTRTEVTPKEKLYIDVDKDGQMDTYPTINSRGQESGRANQEPILSIEPEALRSFAELNEQPVLTREHTGDLSFQTSWKAKEAGPESHHTICTRSQFMSGTGYGRTLSDAARNLHQFPDHPQADQVDWAIDFGSAKEDGEFASLYLFVPNAAPQSFGGSCG